MGYLYVRRPNRRGVTNYAQGWANRVRAIGGGVSDPYIDQVEFFIAGLIADGLWPLLDRLWIMATEDQYGALVDMTMHNDVLVPLDGPPNAIFYPLKGYGPTGVQSLQSTMNFSTAANWKQDSGHIMVYCNGTDAGDPGASGNRLNGYENCIWPKISTSGNLIGRINNPTDEGLGFAVASSNGCSIASRTGPTTTVIYRNGTAIGTETIASVAVQNDVFYVLGCGPSTNLDFTHTYGAVSVGAGLTGPQAVALTNRVTAMLAAMGAS